MKNSAIVLFSSGLDSTVSLYMAREKYSIYKTLTFDYGQKSFSKEWSQAQEISNSLQIDSISIDLPWYKKLLEKSTSSLTNRNKEIPTSAVNIKNKQASLETAKQVWVPNRNGLFINIAAAYAEAHSVKYVIVGFNKEEAETFPDNTSDFLVEINDSLKYSTSNQVEVVSPTIELNKNEIVKEGVSKSVPFDKLWPCYKNQKNICRVCESCQRFLSALDFNGIKV